MKKQLSLLLSLSVVLSMTAVVALAANPLSRSDFSYGGREVKNYKNFVPRVLEGGDAFYFFVEPSDYCTKANRGINIGSNYSKIGDAYGRAKVVKLSESSMPEYAKGDFTSHSRMRYTYKESGKTFYKTFYIGWSGAKGTVTCVEYTNK